MPEPASGKPDTSRLAAASHRRVLEAPPAALAREAAVSCARELGVAPADVEALELAVGEMVANAHRHGHAPVTVTIEGGAEAVWVQVDDDGPGPAVAVEAAAEPSVTGTSGRGRWLLRHLEVEVEEAWTAAGYSVRVGVLRSLPEGRPTKG